MGRDSMFENICIIHCWSWSNMWFLEKAHLEMLTPTMRLIRTQADVTDILTRASLAFQYPPTTTTKMTWSDSLF